MKRCLYTHYIYEISKIKNGKCDFMGPLKQNYWKCDFMGPLNQTMGNVILWVL